jgi:hypothetical protein
MAITWDNPKALQQVVLQAEAEYDRKAVQFLAKVGERACAKAKDLGTYTDRTKHLRNSISYLVVQDGVIKIDAFGFTPAMAESRTYAAEQAQKYPRDTILIWASGKEYAAYVEARNYDVLAGSGNYIESISDSLVAEFARYLKK